MVIIVDIVDIFRLIWFFFLGRIGAAFPRVTNWNILNDEDNGGVTSFQTSSTTSGSLAYRSTNSKVDRTSDEEHDDGDRTAGEEDHDVDDDDSEEDEL